jgi:hypothetical protein
VAVPTRQRPSKSRRNSCSAAVSCTSVEPLAEVRPVVSRSSRRTVRETHAPNPIVAPALRLAHLFDDLVGASEPCGRHGQAYRFGGLDVDQQLNFSGLLNR